VLAVVVDPPRPVELLVDSAENWFVRAEEGGRVRLYLQLSAPRQAFGSQFLPVSREALSPYLPAVPVAVVQVAQRVLRHIGVADETVPAAALTKLVNYFRSFRESDVLPQASLPSELYQEISLTQKGVCRHRSYAFVVTALSWGLPARLVHNEAHAWAEVFDSELWHRIDLGGAASDLVVPEAQSEALRHRPPSDPFAWPTEERAASVEFERRLTAAQKRSSPGPASVNSGTNTAQSPAQPGSDPSRAVSSAPGEPAPSPGSPGAQGPLVEFHVQGRVLDENTGTEGYPRGATISVRGRVTQDGQACAQSRVNVVLGLSSGPLTIGSLATDGLGDFAGQVTLPSTLPVGKATVDVQLGSGCRRLAP